jgi:hypothetical protein
VLYDEHFNAAGNINQRTTIAGGEWTLAGLANGSWHISGFLFYRAYRGYGIIGFIVLYESD